MKSSLLSLKRETIKEKSSEKLKFPSNIVLSNLLKSLKVKLIAKCLQVELSLLSWP